MFTHLASGRHKAESTFSEEVAAFLRVLAARHAVAVTTPHPLAAIARRNRAFGSHIGWCGRQIVLIEVSKCFMAVIDSSIVSTQ